MRISPTLALAPSGDEDGHRPARNRGPGRCGGRKDGVAEARIRGRRHTQRHLRTRRARHLVRHAPPLPLSPNTKTQIAKKKREETHSVRSSPPHPRLLPQARARSRLGLRHLGAQLVAVLGTDVDQSSSLLHARLLFIIIGIRRSDEGPRCFSSLW